MGDTLNPKPGPGLRSTTDLSAAAGHDGRRPGRLGPVEALGEPVENAAQAGPALLRPPVLGQQFVQVQGRPQLEGAGVLLPGPADGPAVGGLGRAALALAD